MKKAWKHCSSRERRVIRRCHRCCEYKTKTKQVFVGKYKVRMCQPCIAKPRQPAGRPKVNREIKPREQPKKEVKIKAKITMSKDVYDDSRDARRWEAHDAAIWKRETERIINKS